MYSGQNNQNMLLIKTEQEMDDSDASDPTFRKQFDSGKTDFTIRLVNQNNKEIKIFKRSYGYQNKHLTKYFDNKQDFINITNEELDSPYEIIRETLYYLQIGAQYFPPNNTGEFLRCCIFFNVEYDKEDICSSKLAFNAFNAPIKFQNPQNLIKTIQLIVEKDKDIKDKIINDNVEVILFQNGAINPQIFNISEEILVQILKTQIKSQRGQTYDQSLINHLKNILKNYFLNQQPGHQNQDLDNISKMDQTLMNQFLSSEKNSQSQVYIDKLKDLLYTFQQLEEKSAKLEKELKAKDDEIEAMKFHKEICQECIDKSKGIYNQQQGLELYKQPSYDQYISQIKPPETNHYLLNNQQPIQYPIQQSIQQPFQQPFQQPNQQPFYQLFKQPIQQPQIQPNPIINRNKVIYHRQNDEQFKCNREETKLYTSETCQCVSCVQCLVMYLDVGTNYNFTNYDYQFSEQIMSKFKVSCPSCNQKQFLDSETAQIKLLMFN